jgi:DNA-directed RNA polymerase alpha subunit
MDRTPIINTKTRKRAINKEQLVKLSSAHLKLLIEDCELILDNRHIRHRDATTTAIYAMKEKGMISSRLYHCLRARLIEDIAEIEKYSVEYIKCTRNMGKETFTELTALMKKRKLNFTNFKIK